MAIKAVLSADRNSVTVNGLFQWNYGQVLEIETEEIESEIVEVHFACASMSEAIVRPCSFVDGVGTVTIPDQCLEQASAITAWVYRINGTQGYTWKVINLPVTARTRPCVNRDEIPTEICDRYTELITEVNEALSKLESGEVSAEAAERAKTAATANYATTAGSAGTANYATSAGNAASAGKATQANGLYLNSLGASVTYFGLGDAASGLYVVNVTPPDETNQYTILLSVDENVDIIKGTENNGISATYYKVVEADGSIGRYIYPLKDGSQKGTIKSVFKIANYPVG